MSEPNKHSMTIELDVHAKQRIDSLANARGQTANTLISDAIAYFLDRTDNLTEAEKAAIGTWEHCKATGLHVTMEEADTWLAELEEGRDTEPPECHR